MLLRDGEPLLYVERGGRGVLRLSPLEGSELEEALAEIADAAHDGLIPKLGDRATRRGGGDRLAATKRR